ncbi:MAG TPA: hypothetical protein VNT55_17810 [Baekduia sp.]|nr:hypothetical protein [Baekduia sp.]
MAVIAAAVAAAPAAVAVAATGHHASASRPGPHAVHRHAAARTAAALPTAVTAFQRVATPDDAPPARLRKALANLPVGDASGGMVRRIGPRDQRLYAIAGGTNVCLALYWDPQDLDGGYGVGCTTIDGFLANGFTGWTALDATHTLAYGLAPAGTSRFSATTAGGATPLPVSDSGFVTVVKGTPSRISWQDAAGTVASVAFPDGAAG